MGKIKHDFWHLSKTNPKEYNRLYARYYREKTTPRQDLAQHLLLERLNELPAGVKPIPDWPTYYASEDGCIFRDSRATAKRGHGKIIQLKANWNRKVNYYQVQPYNKEGKRKLMYVHRLVLAAYSGEMRDDMQVNHKNLDRADNNANNLEWVTFNENIQHFMDSGFVKKDYVKFEGGRKKSNTKYAHLKPRMKELLEAGFHHSDIAKMLDVTPNAVYQFKISRGYDFY
jgi:hypothetical protein